MISVVIPTLNAERRLAACLTALVPAAIEGFVREVIVVDGGSSDRTLKVADQAGASVLSSAPGRGAQLGAGAKAARQPWLLFLHADTVLSSDWELEAAAFMNRVDLGDLPSSAATFRFALEYDSICSSSWRTCFFGRLRSGMVAGNQSRMASTFYDYRDVSSRLYGDCIRSNH